MQTLFRIAVIFVLSSLALPMQGWAQESADTVDVVATGFGRDIPSATNNALRAAVEQVVGSMVYAETLVESGQMISDRILSSSVGYIESSRVLGEPTVTDDGFVSVRVFATVKRRALGNKLLRTGVNRVFFDGAGFSLMANMRARSLDDTFDLMEQMVDNLHVSALSTSLISRNYDTIRNRIVFEIETKIDPDRYVTFIRSLVNLLPNVNGETVETSQTMTLEMGEGNQAGVTMTFPETLWGRIPDVGRTTGVGHLLIVNSWENSMRVARRYNATADLYTIPIEEYRVIVRFFQRRSLVLEALGSNDEVLASTSVPAPLPYFLFQRSGNNMARPGTWNQPDHIILFPSLHVRPDRGGPYGNRITWPGTPTHRQTVYMEFPRQELEKITSVRFSYE
jgi:hypothetical protein